VLTCILVTAVEFFVVVANAQSIDPARGLLEGRGTYVIMLVKNVLTAAPVNAGQVWVGSVLTCV
jgi:hypothetical protein